MKRLIFLLFLTFLLSPSFTHAQTCDRGNPNNSTYMLREKDKRCEGITTPDTTVSFRLNSFTIGQLQLDDRLTIQIPKVPNLKKPQVRVQSLQKYYQLDPLELKDNGQQWQFQWSNKVLRQENISPQTLRSLATSDNIIIPVYLSKSSSPAYNIGIYTGGNALEITLRIEQNDGTLIYEKRLTNQLGEEINFTWNGRNQNNQLLTKGRYKLTVNALVEQENAPPIRRSLIHQFEHNPQWLN